MVGKKQVKVQEIMCAAPVSCTNTDTLAEAARLMWDRDCGVVPVIERDTNRLLGILTDRDICMAAWSKNKPLAEIKVTDVMTHDCVAIKSKETLDAVHAAMRQRQVRRVPVTEPDGKVVGIVSLKDLVDVANRTVGNAGVQQKVAVSETLNMICATPQAIESRT